MGTAIQRGPTQVVTLVISCQCANRMATLQKAILFFSHTGGNTHSKMTPAGCVLEKSLTDKIKNLLSHELILP